MSEIKYPQKVGDKYKTTINPAFDRTLTCSGFHGRDGKLYNTLSECKEANPDGPFVCVENAEFGGSTQLEKTYLV